MRLFCRNIIPVLISLAFLASGASGQSFAREVSFSVGQTIEITNNFGRIDLAADPDLTGKAAFVATSVLPVTEDELKVDPAAGRLRITVAPAIASKRIDISLRVPLRSKVRITTVEGEVRIRGDLESVNVRTETGTIATDVPAFDLRYTILWTASRPRFLADFSLEPVRERSGGRFEIKGKYKAEAEMPRPLANIDHDDLASGNAESEKQPKDERPEPVSLNFTTARGIVLLNVPPNEVMSDLRERPLTEAAKAIIRSGDTVLMNALRRASPKYFGEYERTLSPFERAPTLAVGSFNNGSRVPGNLRATVRVVDTNNRAVAGLEAGEFDVLEGGQPREVLSVRPVTAPVNLVLLLDVSGSIENYVNFIRKAAREFVNTMDRGDRISIVIFNEDVKVLSGFTTDKDRLSESLDSFDAGRDGLL
jgi:hypothetical protein